MTGNNDSHLRVYEDKSVIVDEDGNKTVFEEGKQTDETNERYNYVQEELENGYLKDLIEKLKSEAEIDIDIDEEHEILLDNLVDSISSSKGRALVGLTCGQLTIKSIAPEQDIRLHKGSRMSHHFSWKEGISMRSIDSDYISPVLRDEGLLKVNRDGVMMTRTLAENYPYSHFYKANLRGAKDEWGEVIREVENGNLIPEEGLKYIISGLINRGYEARNVQNDVLELLEDYESNEPSSAQVRELFHQHFQNSKHSARLLEVAMHSLFQVADEYGLLELRLNELGQMRSADKKHGNVADVELSDPDDELHIVEAWDGKYGKGELANDLQELDDKLRNHPETEELTFVVTTNGELGSRSRDEKEKMERKHDISINVIEFDEFCEKRLDTILIEGAEPSEWLRAYIESLAQKRRDMAPIDEPTTGWLKSMREILD